LKIILVAFSGTTSLTGGSNTGGLDLASVMGNGFDLASLTSAVGGSGAAGGLLSGASPFDLNSIFPGAGALTGAGGGAGGSSPFDLSSVFSGLGGKKK